MRVTQCGFSLAGEDLAPEQRMKIQLKQYGKLILSAEELQLCELKKQHKFPYYINWKK